MTKVRTVLGDVEAKELGFTMAHEHILTNPQGSGPKSEEGHKLDSVEKAIQMLNEFKAIGGGCTEILKQKGVSITHLHVSTIKPFSDPIVLEALSKPKYGVIAMENHTIMGGVGTAVAEMMAENGIGRKLYRMGIPDTFAHGAEARYLMREYGLDALTLVHKVEQILGESFGISEDDLTSVRLEEAFSLSVEQPEAL